MSVLLNLLCICAIATLSSCSNCANPNPHGSLTNSTTQSFVAIFCGVDGVCYSTNGARSCKYEKYQDREEAVVISEAELDGLIASLENAGFYQEPEKQLREIPGIPPQTYSISICKSAVKRENLFFHTKDMQVPEKYLAVLEGLKASQKPRTLGEFIGKNREVR